MKIFSTFIYMLLLLVIGTSCSEDFLKVESEDTTTLEAYYDSEDAIRNSTAVLYGAYGWFDYLVGLMWHQGDMASGDLYYTYNDAGEFFNMDVASGNSSLTAGWESLYRVNSYCNSIINNMPSSAKENGVSADVINAGLAEAYYVRAWVYYILAEYWGEVPIITDATSLINSGSVKLNKNTRSSIYEFIRRDLVFACANLPISDEDGRATKCAAQGLMAKLYLTMASDLTDTNSDTYYSNAKAYADSAINNTGGYGIIDDFDELFTIDGNNNEESLFAIQMIGAGGYGYGNPRTVSWARSTEIADIAWGSGIGPTLDLQSIYEDDDVRRKSTFMLLGDYYAELNQERGGYTYNIVSNSGESANNMLSNVKKYVIGKASDNNGEVGTNQDAGNNLYLMRFSELYLLYCEAAIGSGESTSDATALSYINTVRERAGLADLEAPLTYDQMMEERRAEFAMESIRWFDIKRMYYRDAETAVSFLEDQYRLSGYAANSNADVEMLNTYEGYSKFSGNVDVTADYIKALPIPADAITSNPLLEQDAVEYDFN